MNNCECIFELFQRTESITFMILKKETITAEALRTINLNNFVSLSFTAENLEVLVIQTI